MPYFEKKPIIVKAEQWYPDKPVEGVYEWNEYGYGGIDTLEGPMIVSPGDWIITGIKGEKYPCKLDIFALTYKLVEYYDFPAA